MRAYISLHTEKPQSQIDHEVVYDGYHRMEVEFGDHFASQPINIKFPIIAKDSPDVVRYIAIGATETSQGELFMCIPAVPFIPLVTTPERLNPEWWIANGASADQAEEYARNFGHVAPSICICNTNPIELPSDLNPIARIAHQLVYSGLMDAADLHPRLYEAINDALHNAGVPVIPVIRSGAAAIKGDIGKLQLSGWGTA